MLLGSLRPRLLATLAAGENNKVDDPSTTLSPRTRDRKSEILKSGKRIIVFKGCECVSINKKGEEYSAQYRNEKGKDETVISKLPVILATGFNVGKSKKCVLKDISEFDESGRPVLSQDCDEVVKTKGVFVVGPIVKHVVDVEEKGEEKGEVRGGTCMKDRTNEVERSKTKEEVIFCFIYKFRCRFALVAGEILSRLTVDYHSIKTNEDGTVVVDEEGHEKLESVEKMCRNYQEKGMLITDLSCAVCGDVGSC